MVTGKNEALLVAGNYAREYTQKMQLQSAAASGQLVVFDLAFDKLVSHANAFCYYSQQKRKPTRQHAYIFVEM